MSKVGVNWYDMNVLTRNGINWNDMNVLTRTGSIGMILEY